MKKIINELVFFIMIICLLFLFSDSLSIFAGNEENVKDESILTKINVETNDVNVYFYDLGTHRNGDSYIITVADVQILVDAGADENSAQHIIKNMKYFLEKDKTGEWDYVIFTHPHKDHISNASVVFDLRIKSCL